MQSVIRVLMNYLVFAIFILITFKKSLRYNFLISMLLAGSLATCSALAVNFYTNTGNTLTLSNSYIILLWFVVAMFIIKTVIKNSFSQLFYTILMCINLYHNIMLLSVILIKYRYPNNFMGIPLTIFNMILLFVHLPFFWLLFVKLNKNILETKAVLRFWKFAWIFPLITYLIYVVKIFSEYIYTETPITSKDIVFAILWNIIIYLIFFIILYSIIQTHKGFQAEEQKNLVKRQLELQKKQYETLTANFEKNIRLRHDFRHHLITISNYAKNNNNEELVNYLHTYIKDLVITSIPQDETSLSSNRTINTILHHYILQAKKQNITVNASVQIPEFCTILDMDLCVIFGNLTENALEACLQQTKENRFINITATIKEQHLFISIENSFTNEINKKNDVFYSTKHKEQAIGLSSVCEIVNKSNGNIKIIHENGIFKVHIHLPIK